jgi:glycine hydroxymethyltransferase
MPITLEATATTEVHDPSVLAAARGLLDNAASPRAMAQLVEDAVKRNEKWRGEECINLLAPEAPTSKSVRALLSSEVGTRAAEGHIGAVNRWFAGTKHIDEIESLCVELLKQVFKARYADHRLCASMIGNQVVYASMTQPGDVIMSVPQPVGGHSSNRIDGPAGVRGLKIVDVPFDPSELTVDIEQFRRIAPLVRPKLVVLGTSMTLFPFPLREMKEIVSEWGGSIYFDGAHQIGLIGAGIFQDPLREGASVLTGSAGKTFSGPQSGIIVWDDPELTESITHSIFPVMAATHQVNRVAALAVAAAEFLAYGKEYMNQIVTNSKALAKALDDRGIPIICAHKGYTTTHQVIADVSGFDGRGIEVARRLAAANIITNKNLLPKDSANDWDYPSGLRIGTIEVTRLGMREPEMGVIADLIERVLVKNERPEAVAKDVIAFRRDRQTLYYSFEAGLPAQ